QHHGVTGDCTRATRVRHGRRSAVAVLLRLAAGLVGDLFGGVADLALGFGEAGAGDVLGLPGALRDIVLDVAGKVLRHVARLARGLAHDRAQARTLVAVDALGLVEDLVAVGPDGAVLAPG